MGRNKQRTSNPRPPREPPSDLNAEETVLGSIMLDPAYCVDKISSLSPAEFYRDKHRWIFQAILNVMERGENIDPISIRKDLEARGLIEAVGRDFLPALIENTPTSVYIESAVQTVKRASDSRRLLGITNMIADMVYAGEESIDVIYDKAEGLLSQAHQSLSSRRLNITNPRIISTNPRRYTMNINGKDIKLNLGEITSWARFRSEMISQLDFVPLKPRDWDGYINKLLQGATKIDAPVDASEEYQIKIQVKRWLDRMPETDSYEQLPAGAHVIRKHNERDYSFFQSTPLLLWLKRELGRQITSPDLWVLIRDWEGTRRSIRIGERSCRLWGLPMDFADETRIPVDFDETKTGAEGEEKASEQEFDVPDWF